MHDRKTYSMKLLLSYNKAEHDKKKICARCVPIERTVSNLYVNGGHCTLWSRSRTDRVRISVLPTFAVENAKHLSRKLIRKVQCNVKTSLLGGTGSL